MNRTALRWESLMRWTGETTWSGGKVYRMHVADDHFAHFTDLDSAVAILESGVLRAPAYAVSMLYGAFVPGVQTNHVSGELAAITFSTRTAPHHGHVEEVVWHDDVILVRPELVDPEEAITLLADSPATLADEDMVVYR